MTPTPPDRPCRTCGHPLEVPTGGAVLCSACASRPRARPVNLLPGDATEEEIRTFIAELQLDRPLQADPGPYPRVVTRHFLGVYSSRPVVWGDRASSDSTQVVVPCAVPFDNGCLREEARALVVGYVREEAAASGFKLCAVFGEHDAVYIDPDGATRTSTNPPRWGRSITRYPEAR